MRNVQDSEAIGVTEGSGDDDVDVDDEESYKTNSNASKQPLNCRVANR